MPGSGSPGRFIRLRLNLAFFIVRRMAHGEQAPFIGLRWSGGDLGVLPLYRDFACIARQDMSQATGPVFSGTYPARQ